MANISNSKSNTLVEGSSADDSIYNAGANVTIFAYKGDDTIFSSSNRDGIYIDAGGDNDMISIRASAHTRIDGGTGNDSVYVNDCYKPTINGGDGEDFIYLIGARNSTVDGGAGEDVISVSGYRNTIDGGDGNDTIYSSNRTNSISGGAGDNYIELTANATLNTVNTGIGNDTINLKSMNNLIQYSGGNDVVYGFNLTDTLHITSGNVSSAFFAGDDVIINVSGGGKITILEGAEKRLNIQIGNGSLLTTIISDAGEDTTPAANTPAGWKITSTIATATIASAANLDLTQSYGSAIKRVDGSKITGGVQIIGNDSGNSIKGGKGDDTITGGAGNDTVSLGAGNDLYIYTGGTDIIQDYAAGDTIQINGGADVSVETLGSNVIYTIGDGSILVKSGKNKAIAIVDENGDEITFEAPVEYPDGWKFNGFTAQATVASAEDLDLTENYGEGIIKVDGSKITSGVQITGNDEGNSIKAGKGDDTVIGGTGDDTVSLGAGADLYVYNGGNDVIQDYATVDTIQILTGGEVSVETVSSNVIYTTDAGEITVKNGKNKAITLIDENGDEILLEEPIEYPRGWKFNGSTAQATVASAEDLDLTEPYGEGIVKVDGSKVTGGVYIIGNDDGNSIKGGKGADTIVGGTGNDTVSLGAGADLYIYNGGDDLIQDFAQGQDTIQINVSAENISAATVSSNVVYTTDNGNITVKGGKNKTITLVDENGAEIEIGGGALPAGLEYNTAKTMITAKTTFKGDSIDLPEIGGAAVDTVIKVDASKLSYGVEIIGNDLGNSIKGGKGSDTIIGGEGNDILYGGSEDDIFVYTGGDDLIQDYTAGHDSIQIDTNAIEVSAAETVGTTVVYTTSAGTITVKNGKGKTISLVNADGDEIEIDAGALPEGLEYDTNKTMITAKTAFKGSEINLEEIGGDALETVVKIDASKLLRGIAIYGNDLGMSIKGGKGADTITGGDGNDTVSLGGGADVYIYTGGEDLIQDYANQDSIQVDINEIPVTAAETVGTNVVYTTDAGTITIKNGKSRTITLMDADGNPVDLSPDTLPAGLTYNTNKTMITAATSFKGASINLEEIGGSAASSVAKVDASKLSSGIEIIGNDLSDSIRGGKGNDTLQGGGGNDTLYGGNGDDVFIFTGGDDYIADYTAGHDSIMVDTNDIAVEAVETVSTNVVYTTNQGTITVKNGKDKVISLVDADGDEITIDGNAGKLPDGLTYNANKTMITAATSFKGDVINLEEYGGAAVDSVVKIDASKLSSGIEIIGNDLGMSIKGGKGADTITGGEGKDTFTGGSGDDIFIFTGGDDLIQDYAAGHDSIMVDINEIEVTAVETLGTGVVYTTSQGTITVKNGKGKTISLIDADGDEIIIGGGAGVLPDGLEYNTTKTMVTAKTTFRGDSIDLPEIGGAAADTVVKIDASKLSNGIEIIANDLGDSIKGSKGTDTITGGEGNDTVSLGAGADVYVFTGGDDLIQDYKAEDTIVFDGRYVDLSGVETVGSNVVFTTEQGTLTVKSGKGKAITIVDGDGYDIDFMASSADLFEDDNFIGDVDLYAITVVDFSVTNLQPQNYNTFAQEQPLLTFDKDK